MKPQHPTAVEGSEGDVARLAKVMRTRKLAVRDVLAMVEKAGADADAAKLAKAKAEGEALAKRHAEHQATLQKQFNDAIEKMFSAPGGLYDRCADIGERIRKLEERDGVPVASRWQ